jgi:hypothetical protein
MRLASVSAAQLCYGAQHRLAGARVVLKERVRAQDGRDVRSIAIPLDKPHGDAIYVCR